MKMKCSVIQDLLPSYADNICSDDTRELVEEHVAECIQCREKLEQMKNTEIVAGKASKKQVDYLKKIRSTITHRKGLGKIILVILMGIASVGLFVGGGGLLDYGRIPPVVFCALIFCAAIIAEDHRYSGGKMAAVEIGVSGAVFAFVMIFYGEFVWAMKECYIYDRAVFPFDRMEPYDMGPLYANILRIAALILVAMLLWNTFGKRKNAYAVTLCITGISYIVYANDWLYHMDTPEMFREFIGELMVSHIVLAAAGIIIYALLRKFGKVPGETESL